MTIDALRESMREGAERQVKLRLALEAIAKLENLDVTDEDVAKQYDNYVEMYKVDVEQIKAAIPEKEVRDDIACNKAIDLIKDTAVITDAKSEEQPAKKPAAKKPAAKKPAAKKETAEEGEEPKPAKKPAAKKPAAKKPAAKKTAEAEEKPADAE